MERKNASSAINILRRPAELRQSMRDLLERRFECLSLCESVTARYGADRVSGTRSRGDGSVLTLSDLDGRIRDCQHELTAAECAADDLLRAIADLSVVFGARDAALLRLRYREDLSWPGIQLELAKQGYDVTERTVRNWHKAALKRTKSVMFEFTETK